MKNISLVLLAVTIFTVFFLGTYFQKDISNQNAAALTSQETKQAVSTQPAECVYVTDFAFGVNGQPPVDALVKKFTLSGNLVTSWKVGYYLPQGIAISPTGYVYVVAYSNFSYPLNPLIAKYTSTGVPVTKWPAVNIKVIHDIAVSPTNNVYVSGTNNNQPSQDVIEKYSPLGASIPQPALSFGPSDIDFDSAGNLYTGDFGAALVHIFNPAGVQSAPIAIGTGYTPTLGVNTSGDIYLYEGLAGTTGNNYITKYNSSGAQITKWISGGPGNYANSIAVSSSGNVYTINTSGNPISTVKVYSSSGTLLNQWTAFSTYAADASIAVGLCDTKKESK